MNRVAFSSLHFVVFIFRHIADDESKLAKVYISFTWNFDQCCLNALLLMNGIDCIVKRHSMRSDTYTIRSKMEQFFFPQEFFSIANENIKTKFE